jgi:hypothetical protein
VPLSLTLPLLSPWSLFPHARTVDRLHPMRCVLAGAGGPADDEDMLPAPATMQAVTGACLDGECALCCVACTC